MPRTVKVAVVGSGLAGLTAAYLLATKPEVTDSDVKFEVHLFEKVSGLSTSRVHEFMTLSVVHPRDGFLVCFIANLWG